MCSFRRKKVSGSEAKHRECMAPKKILIHQNNIGQFPLGLLVFVMLQAHVDTWQRLQGLSNAVTISGHVSIEDAPFLQDVSRKRG
jgi:hypothetical protein